MTSVLARVDFSARTGEELRARLMALVLTAVLVWYTLVVPPYAPAQGRAWRPPEDEGADGEVRQAPGPDTTEKAEPAGIHAEELDWPEYIGLD